MELNKYLVIGALATGLLTGCGSSDDSETGLEFGAEYTGSTAAGQINSNTQASYEVVGVEATAINYAGMGIVMSTPVTGPGIDRRSAKDIIEHERILQLDTYVKNVAKYAEEIPVGAQLVRQGSCGGTLTFSSTELSQEEINALYPAPIQAEERMAIMLEEPVEEAFESTIYAVTQTFRNYCDSNDINMVLNGSVTIAVRTTEDGDYGKTSLNNLSVKYTDELESTTLSWKGFFESEKIFNHSESMKASVTVTIDESRQIAVTYSSGCSEESCSLIFDFNGSNGVTYRLVMDSESQFPKVYDPRLGYVNYQYQNVRICEIDGIPHLDTDSVVTLSDETNEMTITTTACGVYESSITAIEPEVAPQPEEV
jgi:hypothetical protein